MTNQKPKKRYIIRDIIIKPRCPKWERQYLGKKQAEEYFALHNSERHPLVKKYHKANHFLKWSIKLLVPDFLIGHPNLWDNLKTLRKHPQFHPLRMALVAWLIFSVTFGGLGIYSLQHTVKILAASPVTDTFTDTSKIATSTNMTVSGGQLALAASWACGDTLTDSRDSKTYATVLIGSQCWMAEYLNVGTRTAGANEMSDDGSIEKYCYSDTESNCTSDGAFYQWGEAMGYAASCNGTGAPPDDACASPVQGICPSGWHIPSHYEFTTLEREVCDSGTCATDFPYDETTEAWRGTDEGTQLKEGGSSGFEALMAGYRYASGSFTARGATAFIRSSSAAWIRYLIPYFTTVRRVQSDKLVGGSIRCIQD